MTAQAIFWLDAIDAVLAAAGPSLDPDEQRPADPASGEAITYRIGADGVITGASHPDAVLSFLRPGQPWDGSVIAAFCHYVWHFTGPATARKWTASHPGTFVISLGDAAELAWRHAARAFGAAYATRRDCLP